MEFSYIGWMRTICVYETATRIYLVGSDSDEIRFRVLKIDRLPLPIEEDSTILECARGRMCMATVEAESPFDRFWRLHIVEDPFTYSRSDMARLLHTIQAANRRNIQAHTRNFGGDVKSRGGPAPSQVFSWLRFGNVFRKRPSPSSSGCVSNSESQCMGSAIHYPPQSPRELQQAAASALQSGTVEPSLVLSIKCDGVVGVVRFLRGYYLILITKSRLIAQIGEHKIYKVEDTTTIYIPGNDNTEAVISTSTRRAPATSNSKSGPDDANSMLVPPGSLDSNSEWMQFCATATSRTRILAEEARYLKLFNSIDMGSNFYYSHTYDLSHTLQYNMQSSAKLQEPNDRFMWNWRLIPPRFRPNAHRVFRDAGSDCSPRLFHAQWFIPLYHGAISQAAISACGLPLLITLIGRRSRHFAGTRFLKRGTSLLGNVANEVETEQIVHDTSYFCLDRTRCSSYVQLRGSVPLFWSQESNKVVVGRPPLELSREDPYYEAFGAHFRNLFERYGAPIIVLNLMKRREKRRFELALSDGYERGLAYLSQFLPSRIPRSNLGAIRFDDWSFEKDENPPLIYIGFDIARVQKHKRLVAIDELQPIVDGCVRRTGLFFSYPVRKNKDEESLARSQKLQYGLIRINCVDCLDRTNTAQFVVGRAALAHQLYHIGFLTEPVIPVHSRIDRLLQNLYDEHGDTLALQYGGSQLVHNIDTYRKTHKLSSQSRDFLQTLSRYYSNKFSDWDKQCATDLFLRVYRPICWSGTVFQLVCEFLRAAVRKPPPNSSSSSAHVEYNQSASHGYLCGCNPDATIAQTAAALAGPLWDLTSDNYIHWLDAWSRLPIHRTPLTDWCPRSMLDCLPCPTDEPQQQIMSIPSVGLTCPLEPRDQRVDQNAVQRQTPSYQVLDKPAAMTHLRWVELLVQSPPMDSPSLMTRSSSMVEDTNASLRPKHPSLAATSTSSLSTSNSPIADTPIYNISGSPEVFAVDSPGHLSRRLSLVSTKSAPVADPKRTISGRSQPRSVKLRKVFNLSSLSPTLEVDNLTETAPLAKGVKCNGNRKSGKDSRSNEKPDDQIDESSSDSDSTEPIDSYLKFYPPTLAIRPLQYVNSMRSLQDSLFVASRIGDTEVAKSRSTVLASRRRLNDKSVQRSNSNVPLSCISANPSVSMPYWSLPPSVFDPSAVLMPVDPEIRAAYERYMNVSNFSCSSEMYLTQSIIQAPNVEDMTKYQEYVQVAGAFNFLVPSESLKKYSATAYVTRELQCNSAAS